MNVNDTSVLITALAGLVTAVTRLIAVVRRLRR